MRKQKKRKNKANCTHGEDNEERQEVSNTEIMISIIGIVLSLMVLGIAVIRIKTGNRHFKKNKQGIIKHIQLNNEKLNCNEN